MTEDDILAFARSLPGVVATTASEATGAPEAAWGDSFIFYDPVGDPASQRFPFATLVTSDYPGFHESSHLNRPGVFRLNIAVGRSAFESLIGYPASKHPEQPTEYDYTVLDTLLPHPVYATQAWVSILCPGARTAEQAKPLLADGCRPVCTTQRMTHEASSPGGGSPGSGSPGGRSPGGRLRVRMSPRATDELHRASSPLELLFDLTFVVAVASITAQLAHGLAEGHVLLVPFLQVFFAIWWAWMNFTWFASSYDTDDVPYRLLTLVQMAGVLVLAAGVPAAVNDTDYRAVTLGYLIMRVGLVAQWLRVALEHPASRGIGLRYASGIAVVQVGWVLRLLLAQAGLLPEAWLVPAFIGLAALELAVPPWAERKLSTSWHPHHIAERYGLFAIILLGESVLAASTGVESSLRAGGLSGSLVTVAISGLVLLFTLWWLFFLEPAGEGLERHRELSYLWGYGHYGIFAALAALGAGLEVAVERTGGNLEVSAVVVGYAVATPVCAFLVLLSAVHAPLVQRLVIRPPATVVASVVVLFVPLASGAVGLPVVVAAITVVCALVVVVTVAPRSSRGNLGQAGAPEVLS